MHDEEEEKSSILEVFAYNNESVRVGENIERAVKLVMEHGASQRDAAKVCKVSRRSLERALVSVKEGRAIGVVGRPRALTKEKEEKLV